MVAALLRAILFMRWLQGRPSGSTSLQNRLYSLAGYGRTVASVAGLDLLILGAAILARGRVGVGPFADVTGFRARLIGLGATAAGAALWLL